MSARPDLLRKYADILAESDRQVNEDQFANVDSNAQILSKLARVINSVQTPEQFRSAKNFADRVFKTLRTRLNSEEGFTTGYSRTLGILSDIERDLAAKGREVGAGIGGKLY